MTEALGREPTHDELSDETGLGSADIAQLRTASSRTASLNAPVADSAEMEFGETVGDEREQSPLETLSEKDLQAQVSHTPRGKEIIENFLFRESMGRFTC